MFEKVNPKHPDKIADRIAGAITDLAYKIKPNPKIATEVLIGHGHGMIIVETDIQLSKTISKEIENIIRRIAGNISCEIRFYKQDEHLNKNQSEKIKCGDNGIFKGVPITKEQKQLTKLAKILYDAYDSDGKYILDQDKLVICQSNAPTQELEKEFEKAIINPLGDWTGGLDVDTGATNRKLGSDMGDGVTGGGLHGKDLSKADVTLNIYAHLKAQQTGKEVKLSCAIGDEIVDGKPYEEWVEIAREYIQSIGGFEAFAEWGLIR